MPTVTLTQLGPALEQLVTQFVPVVARELRDGVAVRLALLATDLTPVGSARTDPHPGKARASHTISGPEPAPRLLQDAAAYQIPGEYEYEREAAAVPLEGMLYVSDAAETRYGSGVSYFGLLEPGRRQYSRIRNAKRPGHFAAGATMWIGSVEAKDGIYAPALKQLEALAGQIEQAAIRAAEARFRV